MNVLTGLAIAATALINGVIKALLLMCLWRVYRMLTGERPFTVTVVRSEVSRV